MNLQEIFNALMTFEHTDLSDEWVVVRVDLESSTEDFDEVDVWNVTDNYPFISLLSWDAITRITRHNEIDGYDSFHLISRADLNQLGM